jgi:hypothetical protein
MLLAPEARSLKAKRNVLRRVKGRTASKFKVSLAEVDLQDQWGKAVVGFAVVSSSAPHAEAMVDTIAQFIADLGEAEVIADDREVLRMEDVDFGFAGELAEKYR